MVPLRTIGGNSANAHGPAAATFASVPISWAIDFAPKSAIVAL